jgi:hypothetical protein
VLSLVAAKALPNVEQSAARLLDTASSLLQDPPFDATAPIESISFNFQTCSAKVKRTDPCMERYLAEKKYCEQFYDPNRLPGEPNWYAMCMSRAQARFEACVDGLPDPGPLDPFDWPDAPEPETSQKPQ